MPVGQLQTSILASVSTDATQLLCTLFPSCSDRSLSAGQHSTTKEGRALWLSLKVSLYSDCTCYGTLSCEVAVLLYHWRNTSPLSLSLFFFCLLTRVHSRQHTTCLCILLAEDNSTADSDKGNGNNYNLTSHSMLKLHNTETTRTASSGILKTGAGNNFSAKSILPRFVRYTDSERSGKH